MIRQKAESNPIFFDPFLARIPSIMYDSHGPQNEQALAKPAMRVAYTLNNTQPVRCTYISEDPLFYLDNVSPEEEMSEAQLLAQLGFPMEADDIAAEDRMLSEQEAIDTEKLFDEQFGRTHGPRQITIEETQDLLRVSRMGAALLDFAAEQNITLKISRQSEPAFYDRTSATITLRPYLSAADQALLMVRELRRAWQHRQGALLHPLMFHPDQAIVVNRIQAADMMTMMVRTAWELHLAHENDVWNMLESGDHHDLTRAIAREARADFRALNNGRAMAAVFEAWFMSERCRSYDRKLIQEMLADYQGYVFKAGHEDSSKVLTQQLLSALGSLPYGKNYLSPHAATILADPMFTDVRDRSNANFLWFIKFEQSFRQTERDLQEMEGHNVLSQQDPAQNDTRTSATILHLPTRDAKESRGQQTGTGGMATIVDLQGWRTRQGDPA